MRTRITRKKTKRVEDVRNDVSFTIRKWNTLAGVMRNDRCMYTYTHTWVFFVASYKIRIIGHKNTIGNLIVNHIVRCNNLYCTFIIFRCPYLCAKYTVCIYKNFNDTSSNILYITVSKFSNL